MRLKQDSHDVARLHLEEQCNQYGEVVVLDLLRRDGEEDQLSQGFKLAVSN